MSDILSKFEEVADAFAAEMKRLIEAVEEAAKDDDNA